MTKMYDDEIIYIGQYKSTELPCSCFAISIRFHTNQFHHIKDTLLPLGQSYSCSSASETTLTNMGRWILWMCFELSIKSSTAKLCTHVNTLRPRQNGRHFADDFFKGIFLNENVWIPIKFSLKFVPKGPIHNIPALVQIMAWRRPGDKPLSEPTVVSLLMHICVTLPQWVNPLRQSDAYMC